MKLAWQHTASLSSKSLSHCHVLSWLAKLCTAVMWFQFSLVQFSFFINFCIFDFCWTWDPWIHQAASVEAQIKEHCSFSQTSSTKKMPLRLHSSSNQEQAHTIWAKRKYVFLCFLIYIYFVQILQVLTFSTNVRNVFVFCHILHLLAYFER